MKTKWNWYANNAMRRRHHSSESSEQKGRFRWVSNSKTKLPKFSIDLPMQEASVVELVASNEPGFFHFSNGSTPTHWISWFMNSSEIGDPVASEKPIGRLERASWLIAKWSSVGSQNPESCKRAYHLKMYEIKDNSLEEHQRLSSSSFWKETLNFTILELNWNYL